MKMPNVMKKYCNIEIMANSDMKQAKSNVNIENKNETFWKMNFLFFEYHLFVWKYSSWSIGDHNYKINR